MMKSSICVLIGLSLSACTSHLAMLQKDKYDSSIAMDEMRIELSDMKHTLNNTQIEIQLLEEKVRSYETIAKSPVNSTSSYSDPRLVGIEKRLSQISSLHDKLAVEVRQLQDHANQTSNSFTQYQSRLKQIDAEIAVQAQLIEELGGLKTTLKSIAHAVKVKPSSDGYTVKSGDTLEKIARIYKTSVVELKKINNLSSNKIVIGQEIKIPHGQD